MSKPAKTKETCAHTDTISDGVVRACRQCHKNLYDEPEAVSDVLTRQKFEQHLIYYGNNAARPATHPVAMESETTLLAHDAALRAALKRAEEDAERWRAYKSGRADPIAILNAQMLAASRDALRFREEAVARADAAEAKLKKAEEEARGLLQSLTLCRKELGSVRGKLQDERSKAALR
jgi:hypothetical protein